MLKHLKYFYFREHGFAIVTEKVSNIFLAHITHLHHHKLFLHPVTMHGYSPSTLVFSNLAIHFSKKVQTTYVGYLVISHHALIHKQDKQNTNRSIMLATTSYLILLCNKAYNQNSSNKLKETVTVRFQFIPQSGTSGTRG